MTVGSRYLVGVIVMTLPVAIAAQTPAPGSGPVPSKPQPTIRELDQMALDVLRDVHNRGAELYNRGDANGCHRMYEGALRVVRPFLAHRPTIQKVIDDGLAEVARTDGVKIQAFRLHEVIEDVRGRLKVELKVVGPEKSLPKPMGQTGPAPAGVVTIDDRAAAGVEVTIVTLDQPVPRVFTATADDKGAFKFPAGLPRGKYAVMVTSTTQLKVPEKYQTTGTSGLKVEIGEQHSNLQLTLRSK